MLLGVEKLAVPACCPFPSVKLPGLRPKSAQAMTTAVLLTIPGSGSPPQFPLLGVKVQEPDPLHVVPMDGQVSPLAPGTK